MIGYLHSGALAQDLPRVAAFRKGLQEAGFVEGRNVVIDFRWANGREERLSGDAEDLVRRQVATAELGAKILELIREMNPAAKRAGVLVNATDPFSKTFVEQVERGGQSLGIAIQPNIAEGPSGFEAAIEAMVRDRADAIIVQPSLPLKTAIDLALKHKLISISPIASFADAGGLMSYSANETDIYRNLAMYVDRILKGAKPSELPVLQPTRYELAINLRTAKLLGIAVPPALLARADAVIE